MSSSYPSPEILARHPFVEHPFERREPAEMRRRASDFHTEMERRRSARVFSAEPVPFELIELAVRTAGTAPSGAHRQPWHFVAVGDPAVKRQIREAAELEEQKNYDGRMNDEWREALAPLGTHADKEYLEIAPWLVVLFEERYGRSTDGERRHNYYVKESCGIAAGLFIVALHHMGLTTLTHTPSPMRFLSDILGRPDNERPFILFPIGYPEPGSLVPDIARKPLSQIMTKI